MKKHKLDLKLNINCYGVDWAQFNLEIEHDGAILTESMLLKKAEAVKSSSHEKIAGGSCTRY